MASGAGETGGTQEALLAAQPEMNGATAPGEFGGAVAATPATTPFFSNECVVGGCITTGIAMIIAGAVMIAKSEVNQNILGGGVVLLVAGLVACLGPICPSNRRELSNDEIIAYAAMR